MLRTAGSLEDCGCEEAGTAHMALSNESDFCRVTMSTSIFWTVAGMAWSEVIGPFQNLQSDQDWWTFLQELYEQV